jgi:AbrB family looped-hinge helix DNA binding protein
MMFEQIDNPTSKTHSHLVNMQTRLSAKGQVVIPKDVRDALGLRPGMRLEVGTRDTTITLKPIAQKNLFPRTTLADLDAIPKWNGRTRSIDEISSLSDDDIAFMLAEQERNAGG